MSDNLEFISDEEYERRKELRKQKVEAEKKRQQRNRKLFIMGAAALLVIIVAVVLIVVIANSIKKRKNADVEIYAGVGIGSTLSGEPISDDSISTDGDAEDSLANEDNLESNTDTYVDVQGAGQKYTFDSEEFVYSSDGIAQLSSAEYVSDYGILINLSSGKVVATKQGYSKMYPASMTKVMTVLTAWQYISEAELDERIVITQEATDYAYVHDCSSAGFLPGETVTLRDLFYGTILPSGGEAAYSLAVYVAGSHEAFVDLMNENVSALGLAETTHFTNCVGIYNDEHYSTCYDIAVIMAAAMRDEFLAKLLDTRRYTTSLTEEHPEGIELSNWFNRRIEDRDTGGYICGAKTGYVTQSGNCAVSCLDAQNGDRFICVSGKAGSSWRCIFDHVAAYNIYAVGNVGYHRE